MQSRPNAPLYFLRHGETDWNIERRFQGQSDIPLNRRGKEQAQINASIMAKLLKKGAGANPSPAIITSPLCRASKTAEIISNTLGTSNSEIQTDNALQEISFGLWEGLTPTEAKQQYYTERQNRRKDRWLIAPPEGESFAARVLEIKQFLVSAPAGSIVVSHSGIMRIIMHILQDISPLEAVNIDIPHIGIHIWDGNSLIYAGK